MRSDTANGIVRLIVQKTINELVRHISRMHTVSLYHPHRLCWRFYTQAKAKAKQEAQQWIIEMMLREEGLISEIKLQSREPEERFNG